MKKKLIILIILLSPSFVFANYYLQTDLSVGLSSILDNNAKVRSYTSFNITPFSFGNEKLNCGLVLKYSHFSNSNIKNNTRITKIESFSFGPKFNSNFNDLVFLSLFSTIDFNFFYDYYFISSTSSIILTTKIYSFDSIDVYAGGNMDFSVSRLDSIPYYLNIGATISFEYRSRNEK